MWFAQIVNGVNGLGELIMMFSNRDEWRESKFFMFLVTSMHSFTVKLLEIVVKSNKEKERESASSVITNFIDVDQYGQLYGTDVQ